MQNLRQNLCLLTEDLKLAEFYQKAGLDEFGLPLILPEDLTIPARALNFEIDFKIQAKAQRSYIISWVGGGRHVVESIPCCVYATNNSTKTSLRMSISPIILSKDENKIVVAVDNLSDSPIQIKSGETLFRICLPSLERPNTLTINEPKVGSQGCY